MAKKATEAPQEAKNPVEEAMETTQDQASKFMDETPSKDPEVDPFAGVEFEPEETGKDFDEFFQFKEEGDTYTGRFRGIVEPEGLEPCFVFEDYPVKGYSNKVAISQYHSLKGYFADVKPEEVKDNVYRLSLHAIKDSKRGTFKDIRISKAVIPVK